MSYVGCMLMGLVAGFLSALLGIGGGVVVVPILLILFTMDTKVAVGTSLAYIVPVALAGAVQHGFKNQVMLKVVLIAVPFGLVGTYLGMQASDSLGSLQVKRLFGILMLLVGLKLLLLPQGWGVIQRRPVTPADDGQPTAAELARPDSDDGL